MKGYHWKEYFLDEKGLPGGTEQQEQMYFQSIAKQIADVVKHYAAANSGRPERANHAKILAGFTDVRIRILPTAEFPEDLAVGFLKPGAEYAAAFRFSNANGAITHNDAVPDLRGAALRITTPDGIADLLMTNAELHHARDAREAMITILAGVEKDIIANKIPDHFPLEDTIAGMTGALPFMIKHLGFKTALHIAGTLKKQMQQKVISLATETFYSRAPLAIGISISPETAVAIKYRLRPVYKKPEQSTIIACTDLRKQMETEISEKDIIYYLEAQRFADEQQTPIEDARVSWGDAASWFPLAQVCIPKNSINMLDTVNKIAFNPWNMNAENFKPLGSMNRSRKLVYAASSRMRDNE